MGNIVLEEITLDNLAKGSTPVLFDTSAILHYLTELRQPANAQESYESSVRRVLFMESLVKKIKDEDAGRSP